jgi:hypothetical protein
MARYQKIGLKPTMIVGVAATLGVYLSLFASSGLASAPSSWSVPAALADSPTSDVLVGSPTGEVLRFFQDANGLPEVAAYGASGPVSPVSLPDETPGNTGGRIVSVHMLPDGSSVIQYLPDNTFTQPVLVVRLPDGTFGPVYSGNGNGAVAVKPGGVLLVDRGYDSNSRLDITTQTLTIASDGALAPTSGPTDIFDPVGTYQGGGADISVVGAVADASGDARVIATVSESNAVGGNGILDLALNSAMTGLSSTTLLSSTDFTSGGYLAVAPNGRALLAMGGFTNGRSSTVLDVSARQPGGAFSTPTSVNSFSGAAGAQTVEVAAGADGTLAYATLTHECVTGADVAPGEQLTGEVYPEVGTPQSFTVPILDTTGADSQLDSLATDDGQALVGLQDSQNSGGSPEINTCSTGVFNPDPTGISDDKAVLIGPTEDVTKTFGSAPYSGGSFPTLTVDATAIDLGGNAVAEGSLDTSGSSEFAEYGSLSTGTTGTTPTTTTTTPTTTPTTTTTTPTTTPTTTSATPTDVLPPLLAAALLGPAEISPTGAVEITVSGPPLPTSSDIDTQVILLQVFSGANTKNTAADVAHKKKNATAKLIGEIKITVRLHSRQRKTVQLHLTAKLRGYLATHRSARLQARITASAPGLRTTTTTQRLTVHFVHHH